MTIDEVLKFLPDLDELRPLVSEAVADSVPDDSRAWAASGELGTSGARLVRGERLQERIAEVARREGELLRETLENVAVALRGFSEGDTELGVGMLLEVAGREESRGRHQRAEAYALAAHRAAREGGVAGLAARTLARAARAARGRGHLGPAAERYERAYEEATTVGEAATGITAAIGRGNVAVDQGLWDDAAAWYGRALAAMDAHEGPGSPRRERWQLSQNLAIVARERGDHEAARSWLERAEAEAHELADTDAELDVNNGWGQLLLAQGESRRAERRFRAALAAADSPLARTVVEVNLAESLLAQGRILEAAELARDAEATALTQGAATRLPEVYRLLARVAEERDSEDAFVFYERALDLVDEWQLPAFERALTLEAYGRWRVRHGEPGEAALRLAEARDLFAELGIDRRGPAQAREGSEGGDERDGNDEQDGPEGGPP